ncbi:MAG: pentapeptide repeat-containing protein [Chloroflexota bacterium]
MANEEHLAILKQGVKVWNTWREENRAIRPDLSKANLRRAKLKGVNFDNADLNAANLRETELIEAKLHATNLSGANMSEANLIGADLSGSDLSEGFFSQAYFRGANLTGANLSEADLVQADFGTAYLEEANLDSVDARKANFRGADLSRASLSKANLAEVNFNQAKLSVANLSYSNLSGTTFNRADLSNVDLREANLTGSVLVQTNLTRANLTGCSIYGISVWNVNVHGAIQSNLLIENWPSPKITVDNLQVAQFIYLLLNNAEIRNVIDTITSKAVLILGRFTPERKAILDALRDELRKRDYLPILFDFDKPSSRDLTETISTLAHMSRFIIADLTEAKSIPQELQAIVPNLPSVPVQPLILRTEHEYAMFEHFRRYPWVLPVHQYDDMPQLLESLVAQIIDPAEAKAKELRPSP